MTTSAPKSAKFAALLAASCAMTSPLYALDYSGRAVLGVFRGSETNKEDPNKPESNDRDFVVADFTFLAKGLTRRKLTFTLDLRDRYNQFGKVDKDSLTLVAKNEPKLNQLVLRQPAKRNRWFWSLGRFHIAEDRFLGHDGVEVGKSLKDWRVGVFGGLAPSPTYKDSLKFGKEPTQFGAFGAYDKVSGSKRRVFSAALAMRQLKLIERELPTDKKTENFLTMRAIDQQSFHNRLLVDAKLDFTNGFRLQNLLARYNRHLTKRLYGHASYLRYDFLEYDIMRDLRDQLVASGYDQFGVGVEYKTSGTGMVELHATSGKRSVDNKSKTHVALSYRKAKLFKGRMSAYAGVAQTANFVSNDNTVKLGANYYQNRGEVGLRAELRQETKEDGEKLNAKIVGLHGSWLASRSTLVGGSFQYAADELHTVSTMLLTVGYRFDSQTKTPIRKTSPSVDRVTP